MGDYWAGDKEASLSVTEIDPDCTFLRSDSYCVNRLQLLNYTFSIFFNARATIALCESDAEKKAMTKILEQCAEEGMGVWPGSVDDLDDAFKHMEKNSGKAYKWNATKSYSYMGKLFTYTPDAPKCATLFLNELETHLKELAALNTTFSSEGDKVLAAAQKAKSTPADTSNWKLIEVGLKNMKDNSGKAKKYMWIPEVLSKGAEKVGLTQTSKFLDTVVKNVKGPVKGVATFVSAVADFHSAVDRYQQLHYLIGMPDGPAACLAGLPIVLGKVPIVGSFYSALVESLPAFFAGFDKMVKERHERLLHPERYVN